MLDDLIPSSGFHGPANGKLDFLRSKSTRFFQVPDQDTLEAGRIDNGHIVMQGQTSKCGKPHWQVNYTSAWNSEQGTEDGVTPGKPVSPKSDAALEDVVNETATEAHPTHQIDAEHDEMVSWLQYPLDDTLERDYCSDFFGELPDSHIQLLRESFGQGAAKTLRTPYSGAPGNDGFVNRASTADTAMMLGAGRAAGLLPQAGVEAFSKVRTIHSLQPSSVTRCQQPHPSSSNGSTVCATANVTTTRAPTSVPTSATPSNPMLPPKTQPAAPTVNTQPSPPNNRPGSMNFSHFSRPAAIIKANLHSLAGINAAPPPNARFKQQHSHLVKPTVEACTSTGSSIAESTSAGNGQSGLHKDAKVQPLIMEREQSNGTEDSRWQVAPGLSPKKDRDCVVSGDCKNSPADQETCRPSVVISDAVPASSEKGMSRITHHPDIQEPTITSSSGGYGTSTDRLKEAATSNKRKSNEREETECQSEDGEDESVDTKKPVTGRGSTAKRSRAAEVHNQSERRRRDRINEKMRALQELIPNSNKTDKASMLDEAIEYLKMLQLQLQMMSIRTGMTLPPMVMPASLQQHMQMPQIAAMPSMGMGMGMVPMNLGHGMMMDMGVAAQGRAMMPLQSHVGPSLNGAIASASSMADVHDPRYQTSGVMDPYNAYMTRQHQPMQMTQAVSIDKYNAYMLQQCQLQQHLRQHQQQPQHLQHQQHQQAPNMNGGPPH
ncbi:uncharacterized protein [Physcomitrium patens]|nr:uncharacterized protein LOC112275291 isoform X2 [Physcomitrium patens]XP_024361334.1 uncharacterized protein LOC112275291 isoform X2 [Physcomitrium patens]XP_024361343.1 uncharacterized protein LOC112275291 isoform X2 [Physcomitrium patens]XP_024361352.1 uncharacterized protein LOC112275291 isoform X2 [Physcomitrium patens]|eukprot:XP_024361326.1 uncharacterized protein LOC112275291 isoform X2 [Physcomitrella patens]